MFTVALDSIATSCSLTLLQVRDHCFMYVIFLQWSHPPPWEWTRCFELLKEVGGLKPSVAAAAAAMCAHMLPPPLFMWQYQYSIKIGLDQTMKEKLENNVPFLGGMLYCKTQSEFLKKLTKFGQSGRHWEWQSSNSFRQQNQLNWS
jgi:hypothetical protein